MINGSRCGEKYPEEQLGAQIDAQKDGKLKGISTPAWAVADLYPETGHVMAPVLFTNTMAVLSAHRLFTITFNVPQILAKERSRHHMASGR